jgi:hypothetical protein
LSYLRDALNDLLITHIFHDTIQMFQACGPSASSVFSLESSNSAFPFAEQGDVFQQFAQNSMESQCTLNQLDLALSQATNAAQYAFQDGTAGANLQVIIRA